MRDSFTVKGKRRAVSAARREGCKCLIWREKKFLLLLLWLKGDRIMHFDRVMDSEQEQPLELPAPTVSLLTDVLDAVAKKGTDG